MRTQARRRHRPERPRHLRRLTRGGLELERRRHRGRLRRCPSDGRSRRPTGTARSRTSTRPPRSSTPSITARGSSTSAWAVRRPPRRSAARSTTPSPRAPCSSRRSATATRREPGRVSGRAPAARRLARDRRTRPLGRCVDEVGRTRVVLQHGHAHLPRGARRRRLRRGLRGVLRVALPARQPPGLGHRALRLCQRHVVRRSAGGRCCGARLGGEPPAPREGGRGDSQAHSLGRRKVEPAARLRRPRRRCSRGAGAGATRPASARLRPRRARCGRRGSAGVRRCARSRGRSRRRSRSSTCPRRRARRSASPCRRGCPGSSGARRRGARGR